MSVKIGVLALQGDFAAHIALLARSGVEAGEIRYASQLDGIQGLILPGGESTTLLHLIAGQGLEAPIRAFRARGGAIFGTCAGAILIAREVSRPQQPSFGFLDIDVERNAYGRQKESFETFAAAPAFGDAPLPLVFIRAPRIRRVGRQVEAVVTCGGDPVLVRDGRVMAATFHPEMTDDGRVHRYFAALVEAAPEATS